MTQEEKQLLLKDLCARLPYGVVVNVEDDSDFDGCLRPYTSKLSLGLLQRYLGHSFSILPYLRPMSSMTEEEERYVLNTWSEDDLNNGIDLMYDNYMMLGYASDFIDWLNSHHFDYHRLIDKGLALEAPEGMYKID